MRGVDRVLRVAWTIADIKNSPQPNIDDVDIAIGLKIMAGF